MVAESTDTSARYDEFDVPARLVVSEETFERIVELIDHPRPPTAAMLALFKQQSAAGTNR